MNLDPIARITAKVIVTDAGCWQYTGHLTDEGYARIVVQGRKHYAHRLMYEHQVGPVPQGDELDHLCRNRACCNPAHLEPVSSLINKRRGINAFSLDGLCRARLHDITIPANLTTEHGRATCLPCQRERSRRSTTRYRSRKE